MNQKTKNEKKNHINLNCHSQVTVQYCNLEGGQERKHIGEEKGNRFNLETR